MRPTALVRSLSACAAAALVTAAGLGLMVSAAAAASAVMPDGTVRYDYGRRPAPVLICKPQYVCDVALQGGESVLSLAIGDAARWVVAGGKSGPGGTTPHVFVKPTQPNLETNLLITTTKRVYDVTLRSANDAARPLISFAYPDEDAAARALTADHERLAIESVLAGTPQVGLDKADTKYKITGEMTLAPDKVFNDGLRTFLVWKMLPIELPSVMNIEANGTEQQENFRVVGTTYIIDNVNPSFDLVLAAEADRHGRPERRLSIRHQ